MDSVQKSYSGMGWVAVAPAEPPSSSSSHQGLTGSEKSRQLCLDAPFQTGAELSPRDTGSQLHPLSFSHPWSLSLKTHTHPCFPLQRTLS